MPMAIVGYSYRLPGGIETDDDFWRLLSEREIVQVPVVDRYGQGYRPIDGLSGPGRFASEYEGLITKGREYFLDYSLFGLSRNEFFNMDLQIRMLLACAWELTEQAGWDLHSLRNSQTGVFIGGQIPAAAQWRPMKGSVMSDVMNSSLSMHANRISYHFNLMGPSLTCCTACSSSLTALDVAIKSLQAGDCDQAIVGSSNFLGSPISSTGFNALGVISPDGKCNSFDAGANGYMRAEGVFLYAVKPLEVAERNGDDIYAVVESTAINTAGAADYSEGLVQGRYITAPTSHSQRDLIRRACTRAGRDPQEYDYLEAHATGTVVGDRIEGGAIAEVFGSGERASPLRVATVKSNLGHMEAAAFHCALLKIIMMIQRRTFAPISKNFLVPNPEIDFVKGQMQVQTACEPFPDRSAVIGINSFGFGGANGHCVVREYVPERARLWSVPLAPKAGCLLTLSARTVKALTRSARQLRELLGKQDIDLYTLAGNLSRRRTHFATRTSFAVRDRQELLAALDTFVQEAQPVATVDGEDRRLAMVFSGQGTQWAGCGRELYEAEPVFRRAIDAVEECWRKYADHSLREAAFSSPQEQLNEVQLAQPVIFMIQCGLVELLKTWGVYPDCVVGHSSGEVAAAYASGAMSLEEATHLVYHRAMLQQSRAGSGRMLAIGLDRLGVEELLETLKVPFRPKVGPTQVEFACENAPANVVLCGQETALRPIMAELDRRNLQNQLLPGNIAFHSTAMNPIKDEVMDALAFLNELEFDADLPFVSSVTGRKAERLDNAYWWSNIREPVLFAAAIETLRRDYRINVVLELAPHCSLQGTVAQCVQDSPGTVCIPTLMRDSSNCLDFQQALGALYRAGVALDFAAQYPRPKSIARQLPGHPREELNDFNTLADAVFFKRQGEYSFGPLVGHIVPSRYKLFEARLSQADFPWLADHCVHHAPIMPAMGYLELIIQAMGGAPCQMEELELLQPCPIPKDAVRLQTSLIPVANMPNEYTVTVSSRSFEVEADDELHCRGKVRLVEEDHKVTVPRQLSDWDIGHFEVVLDKDHDFYERLEVVLSETFMYGPYFRTLKGMTAGILNGRIACRLELETREEYWTSSQREGYVTSVPLLDGGVQFYLFRMMDMADIFSIPQRFEGVTFGRPPTGPRLTCIVTNFDVDSIVANERGQFFTSGGETSGGSISFYDRDMGELVLHIDNYICFVSHPKWNSLKDSKHLIAWQPKFVPTGDPLNKRLPEGDIEPAALIAAFERPKSGERYACHLVEYAGNRDPERTVLKECLDYLSQPDGQSEYWLLGDDEQSMRAFYEAFNQRHAALRFERIDETAPWDDKNGLLRPNSAEIMFLHGDEETPGPEIWETARRLLVAGGLALIAHGEDEPVRPAEGWTLVRAGRRTTLLQAPAAEPAAGGSELPAPRWALGESGSLASDWVALIGSSDTHLLPETSLEPEALQVLETWPRANEVQAIDFFCGADADDPTGEKTVKRLVAFVQALVWYRTDRETCPCRLTVVTRGAAYEVDDPRGSALWGAVRSMSREIDIESQLEFRLVDLGTAEDLTTLASLARRDLRERELAVRQNRLWAPRMISVPKRYASVPAGEKINYRLDLVNPGQISGLEMKTFEAPPVKRDDVEIEVSAAALNFRDIMITLGLLPSLAFERSAFGYAVGMEGCGVVSRVGSEVQRFRPGDEVSFIQSGSIAGRVVVDQNLVLHKPRRLKREEAASVLSVYVTAYYSLVYLGRLSKNKRVLIHSGMGGVGQAAISVAKHVGAEIFATAGSQDKRDQLLAKGAVAAFDSHDYGWYDELMEATGGEGVDVILNSLAGRHVELCLQALRPGGWHCEIGKVDIYSDNELRLRVFRKNLRFAAIDVDRLLLDDPFLIREISRICLDLLETGAFSSLPVTVFPYRDYEKVFRLMTTGQHQGKLVLQAPEDSDRLGIPITDLRPLFDPEATYLVTGGLGGFGLRVIPYLICAGARHITLMDRDPKRRRDIDWMIKVSSLKYIDAPFEFDIVTGDVAVEADVRRCVANLKKPLKGIFHLAGVLDDRLLDDLTAESVAKVFAPKAHGAIHLHRATSDHQLDHFVMFSSTSSVVGNPGQINYSAANAFMDGLAACRRREGKPGLSFIMTAIVDAGMASRSLPVMRMLRASGLPPISSEFAISNLDYALRSTSGHDHLVAVLFERLGWMVDTADYLRIGRHMRNQDAFKVAADDSLTLDNVVAQIVEKVAELCGHDECSPDELLANYGLTSISVAELMTFIQMQFNFRVSVIELMTKATALSLAQNIIHGKQDDEADQDGAEAGGTQDAVKVAERRVRRVPSVFANASEDHFPQSG